jgi:hypothetical protein
MAPGDGELDRGRSRMQRSVHDPARAHGLHARGKETDPQPAGDERQDRNGLRRLLDDPRLKARLRARGEDRVCVARGLPARREHEGLAGKIAHGDPLASREPVPRWQHRDEWLSLQDLFGDPVVRRPLAQEPDVQPPREEPLDLLMRSELMKLELDEGVPLPVGCDDAGEEPEGGRSAESHDEPTDVTVRGALRRPARLSLGREHGSCVLEEGGARVGQANAMARPNEELDTELAFQLADLLRERWLSDVQPFGRASEVQLLGDRDEVAKMAEFRAGDDTQDVSPTACWIGGVSAGAPSPPTRPRR